MDNETFDQIALGPDVIGDSLKFVKENENVTIVSHAGNAFQVEPPISVELLVTECEPGEKETQHRVLQNHVSLKQVLR